MAKPEDGYPLPATLSLARPEAYPHRSLASRAAARMLAETKRKQIEGDVYPPGWSPKTSAQKAALESPADILFFGGADGSLKTETILLDAAREAHRPHPRRS